MTVTKRHKVFVSYHHHQDEHYKELFCMRLVGDIVDRSVGDGDIDPRLPIDSVRQQIRDKFIADATVTVVLVGKCTWQRKHVDWEIGSSLRATRRNPRCGLLGILLPTHYDYWKGEYSHRLLPPRLADNCGYEGAFAKIYHWPNPWNDDTVRTWIHDAFLRRKSATPNNRRLQFGKNRSGYCSFGWSD